MLKRLRFMAPSIIKRKKFNFGYRSTTTEDSSYKNNHYSTQECFVCKGKGYRICDQRSSKSYCDKCDSMGKINCFYCIGSGKVYSFAL